MNWLDLNADGLALAIVLGLLGLLAVIGALFVERLVDPGQERRRLRPDRGTDLRRRIASNGAGQRWGRRVSR